MIHQEIKERIGNSEWYYRDGEIQNDDVVIGVMYDDDNDDKTFASALCSAVNATYGNNINPDKVKEMYDLLEDIEREIASYETPEQETVFAILCGKINNLLQSAKLK